MSDPFSDVSKAVHPDDEMFRTAQITIGDAKQALGYHFRSGARVATAVAQFVKDQACDPAQCSILDFACGYGRITRYFAKQFGEVVCSDLEPEMLRFVNEIAGASGFLSNVDLKRVQWPKRQFDVVFSFSLFTHLNPEIWEDWFWALSACVKPGGLMFFSTRGVAFARRMGETVADDEIIRFAEKNETSGRLNTSVYGQTTIAPAFVDDILSKRGGHFARAAYFKGGDFDQFQDMHVLKKSESAPAEETPLVRQAHDLVWTSKDDFSVNGLRFKCLMGDYYADKTDKDHVVILKNQRLIKDNIDVYRADGVKRAFEFGIFQGGSIMLLTEALGLEKMGALDFSDPVAPLDELIAKRGLSERVKLFYNVSQRERERVNTVLSSLFKPGELDLIIDDGAHFYDTTKTCFEVAFPFLRPGGLYVVEDWGWAHWPGYWQSPEARWRDQPAMSNFIFELVMMAATSPKLIESVTVHEAMVYVRKAKDAPIGKPLMVEQHYALRGKQLSQI